jgi:ribosomal protein S6--L-glutamate ligase
LFINQLNTAADDLGIQLSWLSDFWVAQLEKDALVKYVIGYTFPLNNASAAQVASDKVAAAAILSASRLPVVPHRLLRFSTAEPAEWASAVLAGTDLPIVVKPYKESSGIDVYRATTRTELRDDLALLARRYWAVAVSPYIDIVDEYRVVVLDRNVKLIYRKVRVRNVKNEAAEWRHNLLLGAYPEILESTDLYQSLSTLAAEAMTALDLTFASVDIVMVGDQLQILEVNSSVTLERFGLHTPAYADIALTIYKDALHRSFGF